MKNIAQRALRAIGVKAFRLGTRRGIDVVYDVMRLLPPAPLCFDVGANVGAFTRRLLSESPASNIIAFEPDPDTFRQLCMNVSRANVQCVQMAVGDRMGEVYLRRTGKSEWNRVVDRSAEDAVPVRMITIEDFCRENGIREIGLLKTDCEGLDTKVIEGAKGILPNVASVYCEVDFRRGAEFGDFFAINELLTREGFYFYALYDYSGLSRPVHRSFANALWVRAGLSPGL